VLRLPLLGIFVKGAGVEEVEERGREARTGEGELE